MGIPSTSHCDVVTRFLNTYSSHGYWAKATRRTGIAGPRSPAEPWASATRRTGIAPHNVRRAQKSRLVGGSVGAWKGYRISRYTHSITHSWRLTPGFSEKNHVASSSQSCRRAMHFSMVIYRARSPDITRRRINKVPIISMVILQSYTMRTILAMREYLTQTCGYPGSE